MTYNKYAGNCDYCNNRVAARAGKLIGKRNGRWTIAHLACADKKGARVSSIHFPSTGTTIYQNSRGRCIDAPCCGCCT